ncbi:MAG: hypothetical protein C5B54_04255 [Acidobacteria bacterium]|nr:MAG: hypothetical protein C5B54_04255 [Acidobacteriota bacterium]
MKLSELRPRQQNREQQPHDREQLGVIRQATALPKPIDALYQGQPVRIVATGDVVGMSPSVQIVDEDGRLDWVSTEDVQITQRRFLPASNRAQFRQKTSRQSASQSRPQYQTT